LLFFNLENVCDYYLLNYILKIDLMFSSEENPNEISSRIKV
jgi:hypothetical protein